MRLGTEVPYHQRAHLTACHNKVWPAAHHRDGAQAAEGVEAPRRSDGGCALASERGGEDGVEPRERAQRPGEGREGAALEARGPGDLRPREEDKGVVSSIPLRADADVGNANVRTDASFHEALREPETRLAARLLPLARAGGRGGGEPLGDLPVRRLGHGCLEERQHTPQEGQQLTGRGPLGERGELHVLLISEDVVRHGAYVLIVVACLAARAFRVAVFQRLARQEEVDVLLLPLLEEVDLLNAPLVHDLQPLEVAEPLQGRTLFSRGGARVELGHAGLVVSHEAPAPLAGVCCRRCSGIL
mmetsp:Transcript_5710/g.16571  ORF Transcript_5710/g.16571 Transcript_5710/m.16571 type:complete len:302 (-) Transcript_5710:836-1741(-)